MLTKRETNAAQKRQERLKLRAKMHNKGLTRERGTFTGLRWHRRKPSDAKSVEETKISLTKPR